MARASPQWAVSSGRALEPRWNPTSDELFFADVPELGTITIMTVPIADGPNPVGLPRALFSFGGIPTDLGANAYSYAVAPDGDRFLVTTAVDAEPPSLEGILNCGANAID